LHRIQEVSYLLRAAKKCTKLAVRGANNLLWVKVGDEYQFAIQTWYVLYGSKVMQCGTTNAPMDSQIYINDTIRETQDDCASVY
jgi:hypothetical protein